MNMRIDEVPVQSMPPYQIGGVRFEALLPVPFQHGVRARYRGQPVCRSNFPIATTAKYLLGIPDSMERAVPTMMNGPFPAIRNS